MITDLATHPTRFISIPDLIRYLGWPRRTVYWHVENQKLPCVRYGRLVRVRTDDAREWKAVYVDSR